MATISTSIKLVDGMSPALRNINATLDKTIRRFDFLKKKMNSAVVFKVNRGSLGEVTNRFDRIGNIVDKNIEKQRSFNEHLFTSSIHARNLAQVFRQVGAAITSNLNGQKSFNASTNGIVGKLRQVHAAINGMSNSQSKFNSRVNSAITALDRKVSSINRAKVGINDNTSAQNRFNESAKRSDSLMSGLYRKVRNIAMVYGGMRAVGQVVQTSDTMSGVEARFNLMTGDKNKSKELMDKVYGASLRSRSDYVTTSDTLAKLGQRAPELFKGDDSSVLFMENMNKIFKTQRTEPQEQAAALLQLSQAMGAGALRGEEYRSIIEHAQPMVRHIADYLKVPIGSMKKLAEKGALTSEVIYNAMLWATDQINKEFNELPFTWSDIWQEMKTITTKAAEPIFKIISDVLNSQRFINLLGGIERGIKWFIQVILTMYHTCKPAFIAIYDALEDVYNYVGSKWSFISSIINTIIVAFGELASKLVGGVVMAFKAVYRAMSSVYDFFKNNWTLIAPIVLGVAAAVGAYKLAVMGAWLWSNRMVLVTALKTAAMWLYNASLLVVKGTMAAFKNGLYLATAAQWALNVAMSMNPVGLVIAGIIALIASIYLVVAAYNKWTGKSVSATGIIVGAIYGLREVIKNVGKGIGNVWEYTLSWISNKFQWLNDFVGAVSHNIGAFFSNAFNGAKKAVFDFVREAIDLISPLADILQSGFDKLGFSVDVKGAVAGAKAALSAGAAYESVKSKSLPKWNAYGTAWNPSFEYGSISGAYSEGYKKGDEAVNKLMTAIKEFNLEDYIPEKIKKFIEDYKNAGKDHSYSSTDIQDIMNKATDAQQKAADNAKDAADKRNKLAEEANKALKDGNKINKDIANSLEVSSDEREAIIRIAEREAFNQMTRNEIRVEMTNNNTMNNGTDAKSTMDYLARQILSQIQSSSERLAY